MKTLKYLFIAGLSLFAFSSCMNEFDAPDNSTPPYGNNNIGEATITIADLKTKYKNEILNNGYKEITDDAIIEGVIVANDEEGNVYKQFVINDLTGAIIISVDDVGMYATMPIGQKIRISLKGLYIGGYGSLAQVGTKYYNTKYSEWQIGRMSKVEFLKNVRLIGAPNPECPELQPTVMTKEFLADDSNKDLMPMYVVLKNVSFKEADGKKLYAPESEQISETNTAVERHVSVGGEEIIFRLSTYADFANTVIPRGNFDIYGVLTRYRNPGNSSKDYWQFLLSSTGDIVPAEKTETGK